MDKNDYNKLIYLQRQKWYIDRVGKRVWRTKTKCCERCDEVYKNGLVLSDKDHAAYVHGVSSELGMKYFDSEKERNDYEK